MNKMILGTGLALLALLGIAMYSPAKAADDELSMFQKQAVNTVVQLGRNCSGVVVDTTDIQKTYIVTANHCVDDDAQESEGNKSGLINIDTQANVKSPTDGKNKSGQLVETNQYVFDVIVRDVTDDIAFLRLRKEGLLLDAATVANKDPVEGEQVWTVGYPLGLPRTITEGFYGGFMNLGKDMSFDKFGNGRPVYKASPAIYGGNSGGGMFKKTNGKYELVGITDAGFRNFFVEGFYNPQESINDIVERGLKIVNNNDPVTIEQKKGE
jgi:S1-C subfamily serine protease